MDILHILRSEPDEMIRFFMEAISKDQKKKEVPIYLGTIDYDQLLTDIFDFKKIISWW